MPVYDVEATPGYNCAVPSARKSEIPTLLVSTVKPLGIDTRIVPVGAAVERKYPLI